MSKNPRGSLARAILPNRFLIGGAATLFIDYIDNKYLISRDLWTMFIYLTLRRQYFLFFIYLFFQKISNCNFFFLKKKGNE